MSLFQIAVLALVQGITEFLPISSSAHLILVPYLFGWPDQGLHFDVAVNTGTTLAVVAYFRRDLAAFTAQGLASLRQRPDRRSPAARQAWLVALATVPVGLAGLAFYDLVATLGRDPRVLATTSIVFGLLLYWADRAGRRQRDLDGLGVRDALFVGAAQALALIPGTSRSGITMTAGLAAGFDRVAATRFSFLLAVPTGLLAAAKDLLEMSQAPPAPAELGAIVLGAVLAGAAAFLVIGWLLDWVRRQSLTAFVVYRVLLGLVIFGVWLWSGT